VHGIGPAVERTHGKSGAALDNAVRANIELVVSRLEKSPVLARKIREGGVQIAGGRYDLASGRVEITAA
jgi:carbonic anhydrase